VTEPLAKIDLPTDGPRGPDALCEISVPAGWFAQGQRIQVDVPARLACASCEGGGCDACGRSGALDVPKAEELLEVTLPATSEGGALRVRLAGLGAEGTEPGAPRGHLILSVRVGDRASRSVSLCAGQPVKPDPPARR